MFFDCIKVFDYKFKGIICFFLFLIEWFVNVVFLFLLRFILKLYFYL